MQPGLALERTFVLIKSASLKQSRYNCTQRGEAVSWCVAKN